MFSITGAPVCCSSRESRLCFSWPLKNLTALYQYWWHSNSLTGFLKTAQVLLLCSFLRLILLLCVLPKKFIAKRGYLTYYTGCVYCIAIGDWWHFSNTSMCAGEQEGELRCQFAQSKHSVSRRFVSIINIYNINCICASLFGWDPFGTFLNWDIQERAQQSGQWTRCTVYLTLQTLSTVHM